MRTSELTGIFHETPNLTRNDPEDAKCRKFSAGLLKTQFQICPPSPYETFYLVVAHGEMREIQTKIQTKIKTY
ncbi:hypothetical protein PDIDSM_229 [Penicillium digitatum]|nr:hypothetical protein PDIDSM_229 [Penicillium digitatum]